jgi:hypothetical protein
MIAYVASVNGIRPNDGKSNGHILFSGEWEYFTVNGQVYRANVNNPIDIQGYRQGARWECSLPQWEQYRKIYGL